MKKLLYYLSLPAFCCPFSGTLSAAPCGAEITGSCDITASKTAEGPLYTIKNGATGTVNVNGELNAQYRGEVFRFEGTSTVTLNINSRLSSDANTILLLEGARTGAINFKGSGLAVSRQRHAIYAQAGSVYQIDLGSSTGLRLQSTADGYPAIRVANSASGQIKIDGGVQSESGHALLYANDSGHLWSGKRLPVGSNKLTVTSSGRLQSAANKGHISYGRFFYNVGREPEAGQWNKANSFRSPLTFDIAPQSDLLVQARDIPSDNTFLSSGNSFNFGSGSRVKVLGKPAMNKVYNLISAPSDLNKPALVLENPLVRLEMLSGLSAKEIKFKAVPQTMAQSRQELRKMGWSDQSAEAAATSMEFGSREVQSMLYEQSDNQASLKQLVTQLTPDSSHSVEQAISFGQQARNQISQRVAASGLQQTGMNAGDGIERPAVWAEVLGYKGKLNSHGEDPGYDSDVKGLVAGVDTVSEELCTLMGFALSYQKADTDYSKSSSTNTDSWLIALYADKDFGAIGMESIVSYSWADNSSKRRYANKEDKADYKSTAVTVQVLGYLPLPVQPLMGLNISYVNVDDYHYRQLDQRIKSVSETVIEAGFGVRYFPQEEGFSPRAKAMLWYNFSNSDLETRYTVGTSPVAVVSKGKTPDRLTLAGSLGFDYRMNAMLVGCDLNGAYRENYTETGITCRARYEF
ncbi:autotransporter domain-containing protein [Endozoicomonas sp. OPT23]|uniref:autotransporter outer membrane beta-barrel domain-containing protein n=1 Tax=Endozoicomonas sp. OPT23 TaxID=2072845 RepID=UPI00129A17CC|nr:autotransporter outer membrane beta-barrel domain-containing protein [Endozoicomonas sp. OPT23]